MNGTKIRFIAIFSMLLDHAAYVFALPNFLHSLFTFIGGITYPIFAYFLVEGYKKTKSLQNYFLRLFVFALISQIPYYKALNFYQLNILFTLLVSLILIFLLDKYFFLFLIVCPLAMYFSAYFDWTFFGFLLPLSIFIFSDKLGKYFNFEKNYTLAFIFLFIVAMNIYTLNFQNYMMVFKMGCFLSLPLLYVYNQDIKPTYPFSGIFKNTFFYWFYPLHLALLYFIKVLL